MPMKQRGCQSNSCTNNKKLVQVIFFITKYILIFRIRLRWLLWYKIKLVLCSGMWISCWSVSIISHIFENYLQLQKAYTTRVKKRTCVAYHLHSMIDRLVRAWRFTLIINHSVWKNQEYPGCRLVICYHSFTWSVSLVSKVQGHFSTDTSTDVA